MEYTDTVKQNLNEASLSRLHQHMQEHDAGTITAFRSEERDDFGDVVKTYTKKENTARNKSLLVKLQRKGYGVIKVKGSYIENFGSKNAKEVGENVFFVVDLNDSGNLEKDLRSLGQEFNQDSIMFVKKGTNKATLWGTKKDEFSNEDAFPPFGVSKKFNNAVWGKEGEFMTKIAGRPFFFKEEARYLEEPKGYHGRLGWAAAEKMHWTELIEKD